MTEDMNGLSREHVEALTDVELERLAGGIHEAFACHCDSGDVDRQRAEWLAPTVAAMLAERDRLARAEAWPCANYRAPTTCLTAPSSETGRCDWCRTQAEAGRAEVVRRMRPVFFDAGWDACLAYERTVTELTKPPRQMPSAVREGGTERLPASRDSDGPPESERPSDGRTGPHAVPEPCSVCGWQYDEATLDAARRGQVRLDFNPTHYCRPDPTCGEALGDMRCQLRPGHDGGHEDWRGVAQERRG